MDEFIDDLNKKVCEAFRVPSESLSNVGSEQQYTAFIENMIGKSSGKMQAYSCLNCNHEFHANPSKADGTRCPSCKGGPIVPKIVPKVSRHG